MSSIWGMYSKAITLQDSVMICVVGLLVGVVSPAPIIMSIRKVRVVDTVEGSYGVLNIFRTFGLVPGAVTALFDFAKVEVVMLAAFILFRWNLTATILSGCAVVCGHLIPWYMNRKGDHGWCSYLGLSLMTLQFPGVWLLIAAVFLAGSVNCTVLFIITFTVATPIFAAFYGFDSICVSSLTFTSLVVLITHIPTIKGLASKTEPTIVDVLSQLYSIIVK